jgi:glycosyltransferase involved in cell wall biosynthesis
MNKIEFLNHLKQFNNEINGFSIIVAAYKSFDWIEDTILSIENQSYFKFNDNYEILIGIDGCEKTLEKINEIRNKYKNIRVFYGSNKGVAITRNTLIQNSKYDHIVCFDSDDYMCENLINEIYSKIKIENCFYCRYKIIDVKNILLKNSLNYYYTKNKCSDSFFHPQNWYAFGSIYIRKSLFNILGGYSNLKAGEDYELYHRAEKWCRDNNLKDKICFINSCLYVYRNRSDSLSHGKGLRDCKNGVNETQKRLKNNDIINDYIMFNNTMKEI